VIYVKIKNLKEIDMYVLLVKILIYVIKCFINIQKSKGHDLLHKFKVHTDTKGISSGYAYPPINTIHEKVKCNNCPKNESIKGRRFKCKSCEDYDLCETCYLKDTTHSNSHEFSCYLNNVLDDKEVIKKEPILFEKEISQLFDHQLASLHDMGCNDDEKNKILLNKHKGDLTKVIDELFQ